MAVDISKVAIENGKGGIGCMQLSGALVKFTLIAAMVTPSCKVWLAVAGMQTDKHAKAVATGTWGGDHILLEVSQNGAAVEFDCAHGQVTQPMVLDQKGDFDVSGTFSPEHGGPVLRDEPAASNPARYSGRVVGDTLTLTVTQGNENIGTFSLTHGAQAKLRKCR